MKQNLGEMERSYVVASGMEPHNSCYILEPTKWARQENVVFSESRRDTQSYQARRALKDKKLGGHTQHSIKNRGFYSKVFIVLIFE